MSPEIPRSHPRYHSLVTRERIAQAIHRGLVHETGLIAHGRGEAFDYLLGETTIPLANQAMEAAAACLLCAQHPVISVNGNVVALTAQECVHLADAIPAILEVNLFHRTTDRITKLVHELEKYGAQQVFGTIGDAQILGLDHDRGRCDDDGIFSADVVLVPLEDGDRCQALQAMGKTVIAIDLNPLSRTAKTASITIVDNVIRALPRLTYWIHKQKNTSKTSLENLIKNWDNEGMLQETLGFIAKRINSL